MLFLCSRTRKKTKRKLDGDHSFTIYDKVQDLLIEEWNAVLNNSNFFLDLNYLYVLQELHQSSMQFRYVIVYKDKTPVFISYFQILDFTANVFGELVQDQLSDVPSKRANIFERYLDHNKTTVIMRLVTAGNNYVCGEHGFAYNNSIKRELAFDLFEQVINLVGKEEKLRGGISATLVKDFYDTQLPKKNKLATDKFYSCAVEPNMFVDIPTEVNSVSEYIALFSKKYRNRAKSIFKASALITKKELSVEDVTALNGKLYKLYTEVYDNAKFKLVQLHATYFAEIKKAFPEQFIITGYYLNDELLAFDSAFVLENGELEAHYIGINYTHNKEYELYQNILYNLIDIAIKTNHKKLNLGRTAAEIKSTVGAKAHELTCYIKPLNTVSKVILKPFVSYLQPTEWVPRNPFKEE